MFFAEDGDVEEGAVAVEFYPCTGIPISALLLSAFDSNNLDGEF